MGTLGARLLAAVVSIGMLAVMPAAAADRGDDHRRDGRDKPLTVMTRNLYLGADINRPVVAAATAQAQGKTPQEILVALANATHETRAIVDQTNYPVRAKLLAAEIVRNRPDLVGLQEVALWRSGPLELGNVGVPNATTVDTDFLQILLDDLAAQGASYAAVSVGSRADVEAPAFTGSPFNGTMGGQIRDVRMTMRDVVLMRVDKGLRVVDSGNAVYTHNLAVSVAGISMNFDRGFQWVDVAYGRDEVRFVNTHLEAFSSDLALAQASELLAVAAPADKDVILVCDCNSDPLNNDIKSFDHVPHKAPYDLIVGAGGFTDEWLEWAPAEQGWTSGLSETVDDATAAGFDHRIDMVFVRTADGGSMAVDRGRVTGNQVSDRDPVTGLWPSDHAGVVLRLRTSEHREHGHDGSHH
jgi:endonuclease/exonuclease/phosphatase family metal-dependent hydrolase